MLLKAGVDISRLHREIRRSLNRVNEIYYDLGEELVITSTYGGDHSPSSLHYCHDAYDCRFPKVNPGLVMDKIRARIGRKYDVVNEGDHIHVEYDPKKR